MTKLSNDRLTWLKTKTLDADYCRIGRWGEKEGEDIQDDVLCLLGENVHLRELVEKQTVVVKAARLARSALDSLMGDSDLNEDDSPEFQAMKALSLALAALGQSEEQPWVIYSKS